MADITFDTLSDATTVGTGNASDGSGNFDELMQVVTLHLEAQFAAGRITGTDYATVYLGALQSTLDQAVSFTLSMNKANEEATLLEKQQSLVDNQAATELKQALDIQAATALKGAQEELVDKQVLTETAKELQVDAQTALTDKQALDIVNQTTNRTAAQTTSETTAVKQRLLIVNQTATELKQALDIVASTALKGKQESLVDKQILTEEKQALDIAGATALKAKQALTQEKQALDLVGATSLKAKQALTQEKQALDLVGSTSLKAKQALTEEKKALDLVSNTSVRNTQSTADSTLKTKQGDKLTAEVTLLGKKGTTEDKQILVMNEQIDLFKEQAKGFKWNADAKYLKTVVDAYSVNLSVGKTADNATKPAVGGHATGTGDLSTSSTAGDYIFKLKPTDS